MNANKVKVVAAVIGGSAMVAMGALTFASYEESSGTINVVGAGGMSTGATSTQTTPPAAPETSVAVPVVKAKPK